MRPPLPDGNPVVSAPAFGREIVAAAAPPVGLPPHLDFVDVVTAEPSSRRGCNRAALVKEAPKKVIAKNAKECNSEETLILEAF